MIVKRGERDGGIDVQDAIFIVPIAIVPEPKNDISRLRKEEGSRIIRLAGCSDHQFFFVQVVARMDGL